MSALAPWQKKLHGHLRFSFLKSLAACGVLAAGTSSWGSYNDAQVPPADPAKREAELAQIRTDLAAADRAAKKLNLVDSTLRNIDELDSTLVFLNANVKVPDIAITYDAAAFEELKEKLEREAIAAAQKVEYRIMLSPYLSGDEFAEFATAHSRLGMGSMYMGALKDSDDREYKPVPQLRACQQENASKNGTEYNFKNNQAVAECAEDAFNMRNVTLYGGGTGLIIASFFAMGLRREWDDALKHEKDKEAAAAPPTPPAATPVVVSTSQPVTVKTIKIRKAAL